MSMQNNQASSPWPFFAGTTSYQIGYNGINPVTLGTAPNVIGMTTMPVRSYGYLQPQIIGTAVYSNTFYPSWATTTHIPIKTYGTISDPAKVGDSVKTTKKIKKRIIIGIINKIIKSGQKELAVVEEAITGKSYRISPTDLEQISPLDVLVEIENSKDKSKNSSKGKTSYADEVIHW